MGKCEFSYAWNVQHITSTKHELKVFSSYIDLQTSFIASTINHQKWYIS